MKTLFEFLYKNHAHNIIEKTYPVYKIFKSTGYYYALVIDNENDVDDFISQLPKGAFSNIAQSWIKNKLKSGKLAGFIFTTIIGVNKLEYDCKGISSNDIDNGELAKNISVKEYNAEYWKKQKWV